MELQLISFEQAKSLKELGFPQLESYIESYHFYAESYVEIYDETGAWVINKSINSPYEIWNYTPKSSDGVYNAPTLELVAKWLREEKDICLSMNYNSDYKIWQCSSTATYNEEDYVSQSYEEALSTGIDKTIEILKSKKK